jgi:hypothetical protein
MSDYLGLAKVQPLAKVPQKGSVSRANLEGRYPI